MNYNYVMLVIFVCDSLTEVNSKLLNLGCYATANYNHNNAHNTTK